MNHGGEQLEKPAINPFSEASGLMIIASFGKTGIESARARDYFGGDRLQ